MLTESWDPDFAPVLPPRWDPKTSPAVRTVYLDQWCYRHLAADRAGKPENDTEAGCFEYLRQLALSGRVVLVLSQAHYAETWSDGNADRRWDMAVAMAELTGFNAINIFGLVVWEAVVGVSSYMGIDRDFPIPPLFGWGLAHSLRDANATAKIIDTRTGRPATWEGLPKATRSEIELLDQHLAERFELANLARRDPGLETDLLLPLGPISVSDYGQQMLREEQEITDELDKADRNEANTRALIEGRSFVNEMTWLSISAAEAVLGIERNTVYDSLAKCSHGAPTRKALTAFMRHMPILGPWTELRVQTHLQDGRRRIPSDGLDNVVLASLSPFVDYMVVDKKTFNLAEAAGLTRRASGAVLFRRLDDLCRRLESDIDLDE